MLVVIHHLWLKQGAFDEFARLSRQHVWPVAEACGQRIIGLYRAEEPRPHDDVDEPCEMAILITAYVDSDHFDATRVDADTWAYGEELRARKAVGSEARRKLTLAAEAIFCEPAQVEVGGPLRQTIGKGG